MSAAVADLPSSVGAKRVGLRRRSRSDIRRVVAELVARRDERRDGFAAVIKEAMATEFGTDAEEVLKVLVREGIPKALARSALEVGRTQGRFTVFSVIDALTRLAGERLQADLDAARLLNLVA